METNLLQGIDTVIIRVSDIAVSRAWYETNLGLPSIWYDEKLKLVVLDTNSPTSLTLWQTGEKLAFAADTASYPIFKTPDAAALRAQLQEKKVSVGDLIADDHVNYFFFYDPDGNVLEACQVHT